MNSENSKVSVYKRSGELDLWKLIFAFIIVILHSDYLPVETEYPLFRGGSIFVEFFFITSGYLMAQSAEKRMNYSCLLEETTAFLRRKISSFYPYLIFGFLASLIAKTLYFGDGILGFTKNACNGIAEMLLLKSTGLLKTIFDSPMWYLSAMILSMAILYPLILRYKDMFKRLVCH